MRFARPLLLPLALLPAVALGHPGHDDPDFIWEISHLQSHPLATLLCPMAAAGCIVLCWQALRRRPDEADGFQPSDSERRR